MISFPYHRNARGEYFPVIEIAAYHKNYISRTSALIDSGATISIFRIDIAEDLYIKIEEGKETYLGGVGGRIKGYVQDIKLKIADKKLTIPVVFSYEYTVSFNLLGREEVFKNFKITFDEKNYLVKLV